VEKEVREYKHFKKAILPSPIHDKEIVKLSLSPSSPSLS